MDSKLPAFAVLLVTAVVLFIARDARAQLNGQITVDPNNSNRMVYHGVRVDGRLKPVIFAGPGDPEEFFYRNTRANLDLLTERGARSTYITAFLQDAGGGHPGTGAEFEATLDRWDRYIDTMEEAGIITVFFFFDDGQPLPENWRTVVDKIVGRLQDHRLLIWSVAEEYSEALSRSEVSRVAARIKETDPNDHVVGVHQLGDTAFDFPEDEHLDMYLMQLSADTPDGIYSTIRDSARAGDKIVNAAEIHFQDAPDHGERDRVTVRRWNWAAVMAGASAVQVIAMGRASDPAAWNDPAKYRDAATLMDFLEGTDINSMQPRPDLAHAGTKWLLANPRSSYIAYASDLEEEIGIRGTEPGTYHLTWLDTVSGRIVDQSGVSVSGGSDLFSKPDGLGPEVAMWIRKTGDEF